MTIKLASLKADLNREREGDWVDIPDLPGAALKVRGVGYGPYQQARAQSEMRLARKYLRETVPPDVMFAENGRLYADHILLDWRGLDVPYSKELALEMLTDPAWRDFAAHVRYACERLGAVEVEFAEEAAKNSAPRSGTTSGGADNTTG